MSDWVNMNLSPGGGHMLLALGREQLERLAQIAYWRTVGGWMLK